jgi:hypothetical protein
LPVRTIVITLLTCALVGWVAMAPGASARQPTEATGPTAGVQLAKPQAMSPSVVASLEPSALPQSWPAGGRPGNSIYQPAPNVHIALGRQAAEQAQVAATGAGGAPSSTTNMTYHGGPTQQTVAAYTIFWSPNGTISSSYRTLINRYFQDIGGSSFYNVVSQYPGLTDTQNVSTLGGTWIDTGPYPAGEGSAFNPLSHTDIQTEVARALSLNPSWNPAGLGRMFFVYTELGVESCWDPTVAYSNLSCTPGVASPNPVQCAYHSAFGTLNNPVIYANMPYGETWPWVCRGFPTSPNGDLAADAEISMSSHEHFEAVTDPLLDAWFDSNSSGEIGDKCAYIYGSTMPDGHNLTLNGHPYIVQLEWSNANNDGVTPFSGCADRYGAFNFLWYADKSANPADPSACDLAKPIPPNSPYATGLCASFDLQIPDANYSLRIVWKLNNSTFSDNTFPNTHLYSSNWNLSYRGLSSGGTYSVSLYANGVLLGSGSVTVSGTTPTPTPTHSLTPSPTHSPTPTPSPTLSPSPTPSPTSTATDWHASNFAWYENVVPSVGTSTCDEAKPVPPNVPNDCVVFDLQIPNGSYNYRVLLTRNGVVFADATFPNVNLYSGPGWSQAFIPPAPGGNFDLKLYANGVLLGESNVTVPGPTPSPTPTAGPPTPTSSPTHTPIPPQTHSPSPTHTLPSDTQSPTPTPTATSTHPILGNANCDNRIDGADVIAVLDYVGGIPNSAGCMGNADVDGDGHVTPFDALLILKYWAGLITTFPAGG